MSKNYTDAEVELIEKKSELSRVRKWLICSISALLGLGLVLIYSSSAIRAENFGSSLYFVERQFYWIVYGSISLSCLAFFDYRRLAALRWPCALFSIAALLLVKLSSIGTKVNGAQRWIKFSGVSFQPSEFIKIFMIIALAAFAVRKHEESIPLRRFVLLITLIISVCGLIAIEPDFGTALLVGFVLIIMVFAAGAKIRHIAGLLLLVIPFVIYYVISSSNYIMHRIQAWLEGGSEGKAYQTYMSIQSMSSGGIWGKGPGAGWAKLWYLPEAHTDFIFAVAGQDLGWICSVGIVFIYAVIAYSGWRVIKISEDRFASVLAFGITLMLGLQAAFNIAVVTATVPTKGISLPFVSFGGSGLISSMAMMGILISITRYSYHPYLNLIKGKPKDNPWGKYLLAGYAASKVREDAVSG
ncbi:MAG: FtsW/RodA/SpoVE family cell cycle protein [Planctomycetota bacterium]|jgi:cell division protein FtsW